MKYDFPFSETALSALSDTLVSIFSSAGFGVSESVTEIVQVAFTPFTAVAVIFALPADGSYNALAVNGRYRVV